MFQFGKDKNKKKSNESDFLSSFIPELESDKTARFGSSCETVRIQLDKDNNFIIWLEAFQLKTGRWVVNECSTIDAKAGAPEKKGQTVIQVKRKHSDISLLKAMHIMDLIEGSNISNEGAVISGKSIPEMGHDHYKEFAKREGIIFGYRGTIAEVTDGKIMAEGSFDYNELLEIKELQENQEPELKRPLPSISEDSVLPNVGLLAVFNGKSSQVDKTLVQDSLDKMVVIKNYDAVIAKLKLVQSNFKSVLWDRNYYGMREEHLAFSTVYKIWDVFKNLDNASKLAKKLDPVNKEKVNNFINEYRLLLHINYSQLLYHYIKIGQVTDKKYEKMVNKHVKIIKKLIKNKEKYPNIDYSDIEQKIYSGNDPKMPGSVDDFFNNYNIWRDNLINNKNRKQQAKTASM